MAEPEFLHYRCAWHAVEGHFERRGYAAYAKCEVIGCKHQGFAHWYRGAKYAKLPQPEPNDYA